MTGQLLTTGTPVFFPLPLLSRMTGKPGFLLSVYAVLLAQVGIAFGVMRTDWALRLSQKHAGKVALVFLALVFTLTIAPLPQPAKLLLMGALAVAMGVAFRQAAERLPPGTMKTALIGAAGVFVTMSVVGALLAASGVNLGPMGSIFFGALVGLLIAQLSMVFLRPKVLRKWILVATLVIFAAYTAFDTNQIMQKNYDGKVADAALDFFVDFTQIFGALREQQ